MTLKTEIKIVWTLSPDTVPACLVMLITQFDQHFGNLTYLRALELLKCLSHPGTLHEKGFSSAWDNWCTRNALVFSNNSLHMLQGYCSSSREEESILNVTNPSIKNYANEGKVKTYVKHRRQQKVTSFCVELKFNFRKFKSKKS